MECEIAVNFRYTSYLYIFWLSPAYLWHKIQKYNFFTSVYISFCLTLLFKFNQKCDATDIFITKMFDITILILFCQKHVLRQLLNSAT